MSRFYAYRFDQLPSYWRCIYTEILVLLSSLSLLKALSEHGHINDLALDSMVQHLDRALITTGGLSKALGPSWINITLEILYEFSLSQNSLGDTNSGDGQRTTKRRKMGDHESVEDDCKPARSFLTDEPYGRPILSPSNSCPRHDSWTIDRFEKYMNEGECKPIVFTDLMNHWPALTTRPWNEPSYLLSQTINGRRLVPVEIGRSYVDEGWGQKVIPFKDFLARYVTSPNQSTETGYLAQHNLFTQIPSLRKDISIPDLCWASVPEHPFDSTKDHATVDEPHLNAWFGPAKTITPLHTDGYHNLLCQVVGTKYVRLYPPAATEKMMPRQKEDGIDMSNTSGLDVGVLEGWDEIPEDMTESVLEEMEKALQGVEYWECVLGPGDTLVIPIGWWHYVRSLSISFSVSFWWN